MRRIALVGGLAALLATSACGAGSGVVGATLPPADPAAQGADATPTAGPSSSSRPRAVPSVEAIPGNGAPGPVLGRTPGDYPGRIAATGTDAAAVFRQVRAAMIAEMGRVLGVGALRSIDTDTMYGRRLVDGTPMMKALYIVEVRCPDGGASSLVTTLRGAGYTKLSEDEDGWRGRRGDVTADTLTTDSGSRCGLGLSTPLVPHALDVTQFSVRFDDELAGKPATEWPDDLGVEDDGSAPSPSGSLDRPI